MGEQPAAVASPAATTTAPVRCRGRASRRSIPTRAFRCRGTRAATVAAASEALHATDDYLMVGSDTPYFAGQLRQRLAMLPVTGGTANPAPQDVLLPVRLFYATGDNLRRMTYDGQDFGATTTVSGPGDRRRQLGRQPRRVRPARPAELLRQRPRRSTRRPFTASTRRARRRRTSPRRSATSTRDADLTPYDQPYGVAETRTAAFTGAGCSTRRPATTSCSTAGTRCRAGSSVASSRSASSEDWSGARSLEFIGRLALRRLERQQALPVLARPTACPGGTPAPSSTTATTPASRGPRRTEATWADRRQR